MTYKIQARDSFGRIKAEYDFDFNGIEPAVYFADKISIDKLASEDWRHAHRIVVVNARERDRCVANRKHYHLRSLTEKEILSLRIVYSTPGLAEPF